MIGVLLLLYQRGSGGSELLDLVVPRVEAVARRCRAMLEIAWPLMRDAGTLPSLEDGAATGSDGCCIHSAAYLAAALSEDVLEMHWRIVGRRPTVRNQRGLDDVAQHEILGMHLWVVGATLELPGDPLLIADVTADQFGGPPVLVSRVPHPSFKANMPPSFVGTLVGNEATVVELLMSMHRASAHLQIDEMEIDAPS